MPCSGVTGDNSLLLLLLPLSHVGLLTPSEVFSVFSGDHLSIYIHREREVLVFRRRISTAACFVAAATVTVDDDLPVDE